MAMRKSKIKMVASGLSGVWLFHVTPNFGNSFVSTTLQKAIKELNSRYRRLLMLQEYKKEM